MLVTPSIPNRMLFTINFDKSQTSSGYILTIEHDRELNVRSIQEVYRIANEIHKVLDDAHFRLKQGREPDDNTVEGEDVDLGPVEPQQAEPQQPEHYLPEYGTEYFAVRRVDYIPAVSNNHEVSPAKWIWKVGKKTWLDEVFDWVVYQDRGAFPTREEAVADRNRRAVEDP